MIPAASTFAAITAAHFCGPVIGPAVGVAAGIAVAIPLMRMLQAGSVSFATLSAIHRWSNPNPDRPQGDAIQQLNAALPLNRRLEEPLNFRNREARIPLITQQSVSELVTAIQEIRSIQQRTLELQLNRRVQQDRINIGIGSLLGGFFSYTALHGGLEPSVVAWLGMMSYASLAAPVTLLGGAGSIYFFAPIAYRLSSSYFSLSTSWSKLKQTVNYWKGNGIAEALLPLVQHQQALQATAEKYQQEPQLEDEALYDNRTLQTRPQEIRSIISSFFQEKHQELQSVVEALANRVEEIDSRNRPN